MEGRRTPLTDRDPGRADQDQCGAGERCGARRAVPEGAGAPPPAADGYVFIVDRKKDMIVSGGFNIYAVEVESVLHQHPDVYEAAVVGVPDEQWGEAVKAVVVPRDGATLTEAGLIGFCAERLARMKKPRSVDFTAALPHNPNGKIDRRAIRDRYWAGAERRVN